MLVQAQIFYFNSVIHTKLFKILLKGAGLTDISFITSVVCERNGVSELRGTRYSSICFDYWWCCYMKSINPSSGCSNILLDRYSFTCNFLSKLSSENGCSEVIVSTSFLMCSDENMFDFMCCSPLKSVNSSYCFSKLWWINLGLEFGLKFILRRCMFRGESKHFIFNVLWWEMVWCLFRSSLKARKIFSNIS